MSSLVPLAAHDPGQLRDAEDVALGAAAVDDQAHRLVRHRDGRLGHRATGRDRLGRDVDHARTSGPVDVREAAPLGARSGRSSAGGRVHGVEDNGVRRRGRGRQVRSSHHSPTSAPAGSRSSRLGDDREGIGAGQGREDMTPLPARAAGQRYRHAPVRRPGGACRPPRAPRRRGRTRGDPGSWTRRRAGRRDRSDGTGRRRGGRPDGAGPGARTARRSRTWRRGCRATRTGGSRAGTGRCRRRPAPGRCRTRTACPAGRRPARARSCRIRRTRSARRRMVRPTRRPTR